MEKKLDKNLDKKELIQFELKSKKDFADHVHNLRLDAMRTDFVTKTSLTSLRALVSSEKISEKELKQLWKDGKKHFK